MTSLNTPFTASPTTSNITAAAPPTKPERPKNSKTSKTSSDQLRMSCECCWGKFKIPLRKHYPSCPVLHGDWKFWASPYYRTLVFYDRKIFINHIRSLKADTTLIESTPREYVTPRAWMTQFSEQAMKRQLRNILDEYFKNSDLAAKWKTLNNDDMSPNLDNITDIHDVLNRCSEILCRPQIGNVEESPIDQLKELFLIDTEDVAEITTYDDALSKKRKLSITYNALDGITSIDQPKVKVADPGFTREQFTRHQEDQIGEDGQTRHVSMGGVVQGGSQWSASGSSDAESTGDTSNAPSAVGHQTQATNWVPDEILNGLAGVQSGPSIDFTDGAGYPQQTLQQVQTAYSFPNADPNADPNAEPNADVDVHALNACFDEWYNSVYLSRNPLPLPQAPNARQNTNSNASNDFGTSDSWNTDFPPDMHYQQTFLPIPNAQVYSNVSASNGIDNFSDWDLPDMQYQQIFLQMPDAQVRPDPSAVNGLDPFVNRNSNSMVQYLHMQQQQWQNANTNTNNDVDTFNVTNPGSSPVHANTTATDCGYPQYTNSASYGYRSS